MATALSFWVVNSPERLSQRLQTLGIPSWRAWQQRAGVSRGVVTKARQGLWADLTWGEIQRLATSLAWDPEVLMGLDTHTTALKAELMHLRATMQQSQDQARKAAHHATFEQLRFLLTSFPTARDLALRDPTRPAQSLVALFAPLEMWLQQQGITSIGRPGEAVSYDPVAHQCDQGGMEVGDPVEIRFVGYRQGADILVPARVIPLGRTVEG